jgi:hypothetical protein
LALSVAAAAGTRVERLQCYCGVTWSQAIGSFDEGLQRLFMEFSKSQHENWHALQTSLKGRDFFGAGPPMRALECERPYVLLIDELDKVDDGFEAMLLKILSAWQLSIPEFGTVAAKVFRSLFSPATRNGAWATRFVGAACTSESNILLRSAKRRLSRAEHLTRKRSSIAKCRHSTGFSQLPLGEATLRHRR